MSAYEIIEKSAHYLFCEHFDCSISDMVKKINERIDAEVEK